MDKLSDSKIIAMCLSDESVNLGFNMLVNKYKERVYWLIRRIVIDHNDTDDVVQDTFVKIWKNLNSFRHDSELFTWIYRIATNEALTFIKNKKKKSFLSFGQYEESLMGRLKDDNFFEGDEIQLKLQKAILTLPQKQRLVFNMKYFEDLKYEEISEILGTSVGALKASYHLAVKKIENYLLEH